MSSQWQVLRTFTSRIVVSGVAAVCGASAYAWDPPVTYELTIDPGASNLDIDFGIGFPFGGTLIGDFDSKTNPEGTRTVPGAAGGGDGDTNTPIPYSAGLGGTIQADGAPSSSVELVFGNGPLGWVRDLSFELIEEGATGIDLDISLEWETFRTFNPFFLYPGGIPLDFSLPVFVPTEISYQQGPMTSALFIPTGPMRKFFIAVVPGQVTITGNLLGEPADFVAPLPVPIFGTLDFEGDGFSIDVVIAANGEFSIPLPLPPLPPFPLELPTAPDQPTAGVLLTVQIQGIYGNALIDAEFSGAGQPTFSMCDLNTDGFVNGIDLNDLLAKWGPDDGSAAHDAADINQDDVVNGVDLMFMMNLWQD